MSRQRRGRSTAHPAMALGGPLNTRANRSPRSRCRSPVHAAVGWEGVRAGSIGCIAGRARPNQFEIMSAHGADRCRELDLSALSKHNCDFCWQGSCALLRGMVAAFKLKSLARIVGIQEPGHLSTAILWAPRTLSPPIADSPIVNLHKSEREQSGNQSEAILFASDDWRLFSEVPLCSPASG